MNMHEINDYDYRPESGEVLIKKSRSKIASTFLGIVMVGSITGIAASLVSFSSNQRKSSVESGKVLKNDRSLALVRSTDYGVQLNKTTVEQPKIPTNFLNEQYKEFNSTPTWFQNFQNYGSSQLNSKYWNYDLGNGQNGWGNNEAENYTNNPSNVRIQNGKLIIEATKQIQNGNINYQSARINTANKVNFQYGMFNMVLKLPSGIGTWPAVWFLPQNRIYQNKKPLNPLNNGEIDWTEAIGVQPNDVYSVAQAVKSNYFTPNEHDKIVHVPNDSTEFYDYTFQWTPNSLTFLLNGKVYYKLDKKSNWNYTTWPYDQPFYLIINQALGGNWGGQDRVQYPPNGINNQALPSFMEIKSIAYYPYLGKNSQNFHFQK